MKHTHVVDTFVVFAPKLFAFQFYINFGIDFGDREHTGGIVENVENGGISAIPVRRWIRSSD